MESALKWLVVKDPNEIGVIGLSGIYVHALLRELAIPGQTQRILAIKKATKPLA